MSQLAEHEPYQSFQCNHGRTDNIAGFFSAHRSRQIKRIDLAFGIQGNIDVASAHRIGKKFIFPFRINHYHINTEHQTS